MNKLKNAIMFILAMCLLGSVFVIESLENYDSWYDLYKEQLENSLSQCESK